MKTIRLVGCATCLVWLSWFAPLTPLAAQNAAKPPARKAAPQAKAEPLTAQQLEVAQSVTTGRMPCELKAVIQIDADAALPGYFWVHGKGFRYRMTPVPTTTGAVRLEDAKAGTVWLQLPNKSMLMDQKKGRRLADECYSPAQTAVAQEMKRNPPQSLVGPSAQ